MGSEELTGSALFNALFENPSSVIQSPLNSESTSPTAVEVDDLDSDSDSSFDVGDDGPNLTLNQSRKHSDNFLALAVLTYFNQTGTFLQTLYDDALEWFLIETDAVSIFRYRLCTIDCAPGNSSPTHVARSVNQAIELMRRVQSDPAAWTGPKNSTFPVSKDRNTDENLF